MPKGGKERREIYQKAINKAEHNLKENVGTIITLQLRGVSIPIRMVPKGEERFVFE
jgi:hypothetical protein